MSKLKSIVGPKFGDIICELLKSGAIIPEDLPPLIDNRIFFENSRDMINELYSGKWVASTNDGALTVSPSLKELEQVLDGIPDSNYAYIEQIP